MAGNGTARPDSNGKPHRCGENGGVTRDGEPCKRFAGNGGLCSHHVRSGAPTDATANRRARFLAALAETGTVTHAAKAIGVARTTPYVWRDADPAFAAEWESATEEVADEIESGVLTLALRCGDKDVPKPAVQAAIFLLKGMRPEKYRERHHVDGHVTFALIDAMKKLEEPVASRF